MGVEFSSYIKRSRRTSIIAPIIAIITCVVMVIFVGQYVHIFSIIGTAIAAGIASSATYARSHHETEKYVRFAIRARLAKKAEPEFDKLTRNFRALGKYVQKSAHPSEEIKDALKEAEKNIGMKPGTVMPLVVPLELILGVPHNCPAAAAMLYAGRHPVVLLDDHLQNMLDTDKDFDKNYKIVVSVLCHELAHLIGWNTRWTKLVSIGELFETPCAISGLAAYSLENSVIFGAIGVSIAAMNLAFEPGPTLPDHKPSVAGIISRIALVSWVPFVIIGLGIGLLPIGLTVWVTLLTFGLRSILATFRRKQEIYADVISAMALGTSSPLSDFFRTLTSSYPNVWTRIFSSHPPVNERIKALRRAKI